MHIVSSFSYKMFEKQKLSWNRFWTVLWTNKHKNFNNFFRLWSKSSNKNLWILVISIVPLKTKLRHRSFPKKNTDLSFTSNTDDLLVVVSVVVVTVVNVVETKKKHLFLLFVNLMNGKSNQKYKMSQKPRFRSNFI